MTIRLSENKIKNAILHEDSEVRYTAVKYFSDSFCTDRSIMPYKQSAPTELIGNVLSKN